MWRLEKTFNFFPDLCCILYMWIGRKKSSMSAMCTRWAAAEGQCRSRELILTIETQIYYYFYLTALFFVVVKFVLVFFHFFFRRLRDERINIFRRSLHRCSLFWLINLSREPDIVSKLHFFAVFSFCYWSEFSLIFFLVGGRYLEWRRKDSHFNDYAIVGVFHCQLE